ncbi:MAG: glycosyltransferase family 2 protein [Candidatus Omnitrophica bacterium]|nr:glycosyltransferase family 2 protein [Candidatus Omnitrophota bacterium]
MGSMRIAAVFCVYNEQEYLEYAVRSILPGVERVVICLGLAPYTAYNPNSREVSRPDDRTEAIADALAKAHPNVTVLKGIWASEIDHRNAGLELCLQDGTDYYWLVDGDEVYREDHLRRIRQEIEAHPETGTFIVKCHIFWRGFSYRIPAQELSWRPRRIFKLTRFRKILGLKFPYRLRFVGQNEMNSLGKVVEIPPDQAVFYHFSYARSQAAMRDKFLTFSHAHEIPSGWINEVWEKWPSDRSMANIHPIDPPKFPRALYQPPDDLPALLTRHPYYGLDIIP